MDIIQHSATKREISPVFLFALTLFSSASLMFVLQPMFGKALLPLLGGSASVWNTCMVFYQSILFFGYLYAHLLSTHLSYHKQFFIHGALIIISLSFLPISIAESSAPPTVGNPSAWLLSILFFSIGLPFFILSTTSPLLQKWFSGLGHQTSHDPYYLSMASNSGSLIALLSYPFLLEPEFGLTQLQQLWSTGFLFLAVLIAVCMIMQLKPQALPPKIQPNKLKESNIFLVDKPGLRLQLHWILLSFIPSSLLLGTTNYISIDIATVPLLWVIPLAIYLLSFILVFSKYSTAIHKKIVLIQPWVCMPFLIYYFSEQKLSHFSVELVLHFLVFFISIMVCHGELAKRRPPTQFLTQYYLIMSLGGMLGGIFNSFIAPLIFSSIYEYPLAIIFALLLNPSHRENNVYLKAYLGKFIFCTYLFTFMTILYFNFNQFSNIVLLGFSILVVGFVNYFLFHKYPVFFPLFGLLIVSCVAPEKQQRGQLLHQSRNFYGVLTVKHQTGNYMGNPNETLHELYSGTTQHGAQLFSDYNLHCRPNGYYSQKGPLGDIFTTYNLLNNDWHIGVVGLGVGEMVGYAKASQSWTFFELDPNVVEIATNPNYFTFLTECIDHYKVQLGDARITLEKQHQSFDLLVIDAFTSDAIPTHLLTKEAIELYLSRLNRNGLLVFHISNRYLAINKVLSDHAEKLGLSLLIKEFRPKQKTPLLSNSDWVILARNPAQLEPMLTTNWRGDWHKLPHYPNVRSWTDDFTSIMTVWK